MNRLIGLTALLIGCSSSPTGSSSNATLQYAETCSRISQGTGKLVYTDGSVQLQDKENSWYFRYFTTVSCQWIEEAPGIPGSFTTHDYTIVVIWK
jgi:hypothetical protein